MEPGVCVTLCKRCHLKEDHSNPKPRGVRTAPRYRAVLIPREWHELMARYARQNGYVITWFVVGVIGKYLAEKGITEFPPTQWDINRKRVEDARATRAKAKRRRSPKEPRE